MLQELGFMSGTCQTAMCCCCCSCCCCGCTTGIPSGEPDDL